MIRKVTPEPTFPRFVVSAIDQERGVTTCDDVYRFRDELRGHGDLSMPNAITSEAIDPNDAADIFDHFATRGITPPVSAWTQLAGDARVIGRMLGELRSYDEELEHVRAIVSDRDASIGILAERLSTHEREMIGASNTIRSLVYELDEARRAVPVAPAPVDRRDPMLARMTSEQWSEVLRAKVKASEDERKRKAASVVCDVEWD